MAEKPPELHRGGAGCEIHRRPGHPTQNARQLEVGESTARLLREEGAPESALRRIFHFLKRLGEDGPIGSSVW